MPLPAGSVSSWTETAYPDGSTGHLLAAPGDDPAAFRAALIPFLHRLLDRAAALSPEWSVLYVEGWYDSGRLIGYPSRVPPATTPSRTSGTSR